MKKQDADALLIALLAVIIIGGLLFYTNQSMHNLSEQYHVAAERDTKSTQKTYCKAKQRNYITIDNVKKILRKANSAGTSAAGDILNDLDGQTVVDNSDGHEYVVTITDEGPRNGYRLTPKMNGKTAAINKTWLIKHAE